jgi:hypothetical protein
MRVPRLFVLPHAQPPHPEVTCAHVHYVAQDAHATCFGRPLDRRDCAKRRRGSRSTWRHSCCRQSTASRPTRRCCAPKHRGWLSCVLRSPRSGSQTTMERSADPLKSSSAGEQRVRTVPGGAVVLARGLECAQAGMHSRQPCARALTHQVELAEEHRSPGGGWHICVAVSMALDFGAVTSDTRPATATSTTSQCRRCLCRDSEGTAGLRLPLGVGFKFLLSSRLLPPVGAWHAPPCWPPLALPDIKRANFQFRSGQVLSRLVASWASPIDLRTGPAMALRFSFRLDGATGAGPFLT